MFVFSGGLDELKSGLWEKKKNSLENPDFNGIRP